MRYVLQFSFAKLCATLAAPPRVSFFLFTRLTGTGASGEILDAVPKKYRSSMISPTTNTFTFFILHLRKSTYVFIAPFISIISINIFTDHMANHNMTFLNTCCYRRWNFDCNISQLTHLTILCSC